jgi:YbgC/YbaW family acyl-CoA thioester hydrolase
MAINAVKLSENPFEEIGFRRAVEKYFVVHYGPPRFNELDSYAILWNGHFVNYFENARQQLGKATGLNTRLLEEAGFQIPIYGYNVKLRKPVEANDEMRVAVRPLQFKNGLLEFEHMMMVCDEIRALGNTTHAVIDKKTRSIAYPMPDLVFEIVNRVFSPFAKSVATAQS